MTVTVSSAGTSGPRGNSVLNGARTPTTTDGVDGDWWLDTTTNKLYGPRASGTWPPAGVTVATGSALAPGDHGLIAWNFPPYNVRSSDKIAMAAGTLYLAKLPIPYATTVTSIGFYVAQAGTSLTAGQNYAALYDSSGALLSATGDLTAVFGTAGGYLEPLTTPQPVTAGYVYVGLYFNGTGTALAAGAGDAPTNLLNFNLSSTTALWATANTGLTTAMPAQLGALSAVSDGIWACIA